MDEIRKLVDTLLKHAREVDAHSALAKGQMRAFREELENMWKTVEQMDKHAETLRQHAVSLQLLLRRDASETTNGHSVNLQENTKAPIPVEVK